MKLNQIMCEVVKVDTDSKVCIGLAKIREGEKFNFDARTPDGEGICANAFCALSNAAFVMMTSEKREGEKDGSIERVCPHGVVTFNLSRNTEGKKIPYCEK
ncbi:MAG: hypothetical protein GY760_27080 [Deltaproteobacteria bacterium]|nr:hypothetical protein [Deltaproteobacteria bacterium]